MLNRTLLLFVCIESQLCKVFDKTKQQKKEIKTPRKQRARAFKNKKEAFKKSLFCTGNTHGRQQKRHTKLIEQKSSK